MSERKRMTKTNRDRRDIFLNEILTDRMFDHYSRKGLVLQSPRTEFGLFIPGPDVAIGAAWRPSGFDNISFRTYFFLIKKPEVFMAVRAIWKGYVHFGSFDVPVKLHTAVREQRVQFHLLHSRDHVRLRQQMVCIHEKVPVPSEEQVRGFELEEGMEGICTWTMRKRSYVGTFGARGRVPRLGTLRYSDEVVPAASLDLPAIELSDRELKAGIDLVNQLSGQFQPENFENEHQKKLQELIDKKASGEKISILRPKRRKATAPDKLLETLEASLKKVV